MQRRHFLQALGATLLTYKLPALAQSAPKASPKLIWIVLRGAVDPLHLLVPKQAEMQRLRPTLYTGVADQLHPTSADFGLHPALTTLQSWYQARQLLPVVAVSSGYQARSHFDGQDYLECASPKLSHDSGWLGRVVEHQHKQALAVARTTPISLRGADNCANWYPTALASAEDDLYARLASLYADDPLLSERLQSGLQTNQMAQGSMPSGKSRGNFRTLTESLGSLMQGDVDCAMLEMGGWDTHNNQLSRLNRQFKELDEGLSALQSSLGPQWQNTVLVIASEFGRTVRENGTGGTDHGTGSVLLLAGGKIKGGRIAGTWPGLAEHQLFENRDLMPTSNSFSWIGAVLQQHWGMSAADVTQLLSGVPPQIDTLLS